MDDKRFRILAGGTALYMIMIWGAIVYSVWRALGLFNLIGVDYALFTAGEQLLFSGRPATVYDLEAIARHVEPFQAYYRPNTGNLRVGPVPYLPLVFLIYAPFARLVPTWGFLLWVLVNLSLALAVLRGLVARFPTRQSWAVTALGLTYLPLILGLLVGQPVVILLFAFDRAYRAWERGHDLKAGLWSGVFFLKPSYLPVLVLVLAYKRRWHSLAGLTITGLFVLLTSVALLGQTGVAAYMKIMSSMSSGFKSGLPLTNQEHMINCRSFLILVLPPGVTESQGRGLTLLVSALTVGTLLVIWRGRWDPSDPRFTARMLATLLVTLLATYHSHIHGATLLLVPGMALLAQGDGRSPIPMLLRLGVFVPTIFFAQIRNAQSLAVLFTGLMVITLCVLLVAEWTEGVQSRSQEANLQGALHANPAERAS